MIQQLRPHAWRQRQQRRWTITSIIGAIFAVCVLATMIVARS